MSEMRNKIAPYYHHADETINSILGLNIALLIIITVMAIFHPYSDNPEIFRTAVWIVLFCGVVGPTILAFIALVEVKQLKTQLSEPKVDKNPQD